MLVVKFAPSKRGIVVPRELELGVVRLTLKHCQSSFSSSQDTRATSM